MGWMRRKPPAKAAFEREWEPRPREEKILETIQVSREALEAGQWEKPMDIREFVYQQSLYIRKRWWLFQALLLAALWWLLKNGVNDAQLRQCMGVAAPLFVVLAIPELWRNRTANAMDIECATYFTLRQVYAARLSLFSGVDLVLLTVFLTLGAWESRFTVWEGLVQFVLPFNVASCICLKCLYSASGTTEAFSMAMCLTFGGIWAVLVSNERLYDRITLPVWAAMLTGSFLFLGYSYVRGQKNWKTIMEVKPLWN